MISRLKEQTKYDIIRNPELEILRNTYGLVNYPYINHYILNDEVLLCHFGDPLDTVAKGILKEVYPDRIIRSIDAGPIFARGGVIHCVTQQHPAM